MCQRVNSLRIKVPQLIDHLALIIEKSIINILKRGNKSQATPIMFHVLPNVVVYIIYRSQIIYSCITQVLRQTTYFIHAVDSSELNLPTQHTNVLLLLIDTIFMDLSGRVNQWVET